MWLPGWSLLQAGRDTIKVATPLAERYEIIELAEWIHELAQVWLLPP